jgi:glycosyltransferase involved in cell wall biosynthesis
VTTGAFAGVERYVSDIARASATRGWEVAVVGGDQVRMSAQLAGVARLEAGATIPRAVWSVSRLGSFDVCHAHMTAAETVAILATPFHRSPIVATRHFAARRGSSRLGRLAAPLIASRVAREIAISGFAAGRLERAPGAIVEPGVRLSACLWRPVNRAVVMLQRLEPEKDTLTGLRAWQLAGLAAEGWTLELFGDGSERNALERWVAEEEVSGVRFRGWTYDTAGSLSEAGILLAPTRAEGLGLAVLDAMAAGVPVVASASGGHLETVGLLADAPLFPAGDVSAAASMLRFLLADEERQRLSSAGRRLVEERFTLDRHVERLLAEYDSLLEARSNPVRGVARRPT